MDLSLVMSKEAAERLAKLDDELNRLYSLPDRWLARELLSHARAARDIGHDIFGREAKLENRYQAELVWDVIPEIAYRLGESSFLKGERGGDIRGLTNVQLRERACEQLHAQPLLVAFASNLHRGMNVYRLLTRHPAVGNPVLFALDRFAPADRDNPDWASRSIWSSFAARGIDDVYEWNPELEEAREDRRPIMENRR
jgi:hypothetical protein